ncbi:hypothetical protein [Nostoc sp.]
MNRPTIERVIAITISKLFYLDFIGFMSDRSPFGKSAKLIYVIERRINV